MRTFGNVDNGKELGEDTDFMMSDYVVKNIKDLKVGDTILGSDSVPKKITSIEELNGETYTIKPTKGTSINIGPKHGLIIKVTNFNFIAKDNTRDRYKVKLFENLSISEKTFPYHTFKDKYEEKAKEYLKESLKKDTVIKKNDDITLTLDKYFFCADTVRRGFKLYHPILLFPCQETEIDPWILGYWLGDGHSSDCKITTADKEVVDYYTKYFKKMNLSVKKVGNTKYTYSITTGTNFGGTDRNKFRNFLQDYNLMNNKHIPDEYLYNDEKVRLSVLAGLIDSDGYNDKNGGYEITLKPTKLSENLCFLIKSLGFFTKIKKSKKSCKGMKNPKDYDRMTISGNNLKDVPCIIPRKIMKDRETERDASSHGFKLTKNESNDKYYRICFEEKCGVLLKDLTVV